MATIMIMKTIAPITMPIIAPVLKLEEGLIVEVVEAVHLFELSV